MAVGWQNPPDADIILRASGGKEFYAHKLVLSLASPVFRDMFSVPQPPDTSSKIPIIDVDDPPETLETFLQIIYPIRNPPINGAETLASLLRLADKYDAKAALDAHKDYLPSICVGTPPIYMYATLCACGREKEAEASARRVSFASLAYLNSSPLLNFMTAEHYQRLMSFMVARDRRMREIVRKRQGKIAEDSHYRCNLDDVHRLYSSTIVAAVQAAFEADPCLRVAEALGSVCSAPLTPPLCYTICKYNTKGLQKYVGELVKELVEMAESLPW